MKSNRQNNIDILAYKVDSFDSNVFIEDLVTSNPRSIVLIFNQKGVRVAYKPQDCVIKDEILFFRCIKNQALFYYLYPVIFLIDYLKIFKLFLSISTKCKVKIILVENTYIAVLAGTMKRFGLFEKMVYLPGDWLVGGRAKKGLLSYIGGDIVFPLFDYFACKFSDLVLNCTEFITKARYEYWGRRIAKKEILFRVRLKIQRKEMPPTTARGMVFMGTLRVDSGLELAVKSLKRMGKEFDFFLKIIGPCNEQGRFLYKLAEEYGVDKKVKFLGFIERQKLGRGLSDCFCGINLLTSKNSYTTKTLPAKIFDYFQYLLPVIVTDNIGGVVDIVREYELGLVIGLNEDSFIEAVMRIYEGQKRYRENIVSYINSFQGTGLQELLISLC